MAKEKGKVSKAQEKSHRAGVTPRPCRAGDRIRSLKARQSVAGGIFRAMTFRRPSGDGTLGLSCLLILRFPTRTALWINPSEGSWQRSCSHPGWSSRLASGAQHRGIGRVPSTPAEHRLCAGREDREAALALLVGS